MHLSYEVRKRIILGRHLETNRMFDVQRCLPGSVPLWPNVGTCSEEDFDCPLPHTASKWNGVLA